MTTPIVSARRIAIIPSIFQLVAEYLIVVAQKVVVKDSVLFDEVPRQRNANNVLCDDVFCYSVGR